MIEENDLFEDHPDGKEIKARRMKNERTIMRFIIAAIIIVPVLLGVLWCIFLCFLIMYGEHC